MVWEDRYYKEGRDLGRSDCSGGALSSERVASRHWIGLGWGR